MGVGLLDCDHCRSASGQVHYCCKCGEVLLRVQSCQGVERWQARGHSARRCAKKPAPSYTCERCEPVGKAGRLIISRPASAAADYEWLLGPERERHLGPLTDEQRAYFTETAALIRTFPCSIPSAAHALLDALAKQPREAEPRAPIPLFRPENYVEGPLNKMRNGKRMQIDSTDSLSSETAAHLHMNSVTSVNSRLDRGRLSGLPAGVVSSELKAGEFCVVFFNGVYELAVFAKAQARLTPAEVAVISIAPGRSELSIV